MISIALIVILRPEKPYIYLMINPEGELSLEWAELIDRIGWVPWGVTKGSKWRTAGIAAEHSGLEYDLWAIDKHSHDLWEYIDHIEDCLVSLGLGYKFIQVKEGEYIDWAQEGGGISRMSLRGPLTRLGWNETPRSLNCLYHWKTENSDIYL